MPNTAPPPSPGRWRAYVTSLDTDQTGALDRGDLDWATARELLLDEILPLLASDCECCREAAMECLYELDDPDAPDTEFLGEIDNRQYVLSAV